MNIDILFQHLKLTVFRSFQYWNHSIKINQCVVMGFWKCMKNVTVAVNRWVIKTEIWAQFCMFLISNHGIYGIIYATKSLVELSYKNEDKLRCMNNFHIPLQLRRWVVMKSGFVHTIPNHASREFLSMYTK